MPKGHILTEVTVRNPVEYEEYRSRVTATTTPFGGRFLVRGGDPKLLERDRAASRIVVLEFDSPERALAWYTSPQYQAILPIRQGASEGRLLCLTGA